MYKHYLKCLGIISEEEFNEVINSFPEFVINDDIQFTDVLHSQDSLALDLLYYIIGLNLNSVIIIDFCNFKDKTFSIDNVDCSEDLVKIKELFPNWTIYNYDNIMKELKEKEKKEEEIEQCDKLRSLIVKQITNLENVNKLKDIFKYVNEV